jgi:hypothetical protein
MAMFTSNMHAFIYSSMQLVYWAKFFFGEFHAKKMTISCQCGTSAHIANIMYMTKAWEGFAIQHLLT